MGELAKKYHDRLQDADQGLMKIDKLVMRTDLVLEEILGNQKLEDPECSMLN